MSETPPQTEASGPTRQSRLGKLWRSFTAPTKEPSASYRYGFLAIALTLLTFNIYWRLRPLPNYRYDRNGNLIVAFMLFFNHVAFSFRWSNPVTIALRLLAWGWLAFGIFYLLYWSHVLYP